MAAVDVVRAGIERFNVGDIGGFRALYAPDAVMQRPEGRFEGRDAIEALWREGFESYTEARVEEVQVVDGGETVAVECVFHATLREGPTLSIPILELYRVQGEHVAEHRMYFDQLSIAGQLGLLPG